LLNERAEGKQEETHFNEQGQFFNEQGEGYDNNFKSKPF
jgi:hypothetical protein